MNTDTADADKSDEDLFDEWRTLFNIRRHGKPTPEDRKRFLKLSEEMKKRGFFKNSK